MFLEGKMFPGIYTNIHEIQSGREKFCQHGADMFAMS